MQSHLSATLMRVQENTTEVASASSQIAAANLDLSARTEAQASSLEQTAASMEQITASVQSNQQMTQTANQLSATAAKHAKDVGERVQEVVGMIRDLHESSQRIRDITSVIDGIAFQTNILALNAAVEAARAGEQGRGLCRGGRRSALAGQALGRSSARDQKPSSRRTPKRWMRAQSWQKSWYRSPGGGHVD